MAHPVMPAQCPTCIFRPGNLMHLRPARMAQIQAYLIQGTNHTCHNAPEKGPLRDAACRGGRDYQLMIWSRMGILPEPTDEALAAMESRHVGPGPQDE